MEKMLNCNIKTLESLFIDSHEWNTVIKNMNHVRVEEKREELELSDFADPQSVLPIIEQSGINIHYNKPVLKQLGTDAKMITQYPRDIFVANVEEDTAKKLSGRNGFLVVSSSNPSLEQIIKTPLSFDITEKDRLSWHDCFMFLKESPMIPINSLVLIDRYLFAYNSPYGWREGINNVKKILAEALPVVQDERFDVLLITSDDNGSWDHRARDFERIIDSLYSECKQISRPYKVNIEVLILGSGGDKRIWEESHDRRLISNYYRIYMSKGFQALGGLKTNEVIRTQHVTIDCAYSNLKSKFGQLLGFPIKGYDATLSEVLKFISNPGKSPENYLFYKNGEWQDDLSGFQNRLVLAQK